jgi:hypothetical protein
VSEDLYALNLRSRMPSEKRAGGDFNSRDVIDKITEARAGFLGRPKKNRVFSEGIRREQI